MGAHQNTYSKPSAFSHDQCIGPFRSVNKSFSNLAKVLGFCFVLSLITKRILTKATFIIFLSDNLLDICLLHEAEDWGNHICLLIFKSPVSSRALAMWQKLIKYWLSECMRKIKQNAHTQESFGSELIHYLKCSWVVGIDFYGIFQPDD